MPRPLLATVLVGALLPSLIARSADSERKATPIEIEHAIKRLREIRPKVVEGMLAIKQATRIFNACRTLTRARQPSGDAVALLLKLLQSEFDVRLAQQTYPGESFPAPSIQRNAEFRSAAIAALQVHAPAKTLLEPLKTELHRVRRNQVRYSQRILQHRAGLAEYNRRNRLGFRTSIVNRPNEFWEKYPASAVLDPLHVTILNAFGKLGRTAKPMAVELLADLKHARADIRLATVNAIASLSNNEKRVLFALLDVRDEDASAVVREAARRAYERLDQAQSPKTAPAPPNGQTPRAKTGRKQTPDSDAFSQWLQNRDSLTGLVALARDPQPDTAAQGLRRLTKLAEGSGRDAGQAVMAITRLSAESPLEQRAAAARRSLQQLKPRLLVRLRMSRPALQIASLLALQELHRHHLLTASDRNQVALAAAEVESPAVQRVLAIALVRLDQAAHADTSILLATLRSPSASAVERRMSAWALGRLQHSSSAIETGLIAALADPDRGTRLEAARSLSTVANPRSRLAETALDRVLQQATRLQEKDVANAAQIATDAIRARRKQSQRQKWATTQFLQRQQALRKKERQARRQQAADLHKRHGILKEPLR